MTVLDRLTQLQELINASRDFLEKIGSVNRPGPSLNFLFRQDEDPPNQTCPSLELVWQSSENLQSARAEFSHQQDTVWLMVEASATQADGRAQSILLPQILPWTKRIPLEFRELVTSLSTNHSPNSNRETIH